jgi:hypothetical protein
MYAESFFRQRRAVFLRRSTLRARRQRIEGL